MNKQRAIQNDVTGVGTIKQLPCPVCQKLVTVGGPYLDLWHVLIHSSSYDVTERCAGTEQKIRASPYGGAFLLKMTQHA